MSKIFISWELGANFGHLTRLMPIAEQLRHRHELFFAVRDTEVSRRSAIGAARIPIHAGAVLARVSLFVCAAD